MQPNILDEYVKERGLEAAATAAKLTAPDDALVLEDEKARMVLRGSDDGALPMATLVTGALSTQRAAWPPTVCPAELGGVLLAKEALWSPGSRCSVGVSNTVML